MHPLQPIGLFFKTRRIVGVSHSPDPCHRGIVIGMTQRRRTGRPRKLAGPGLAVGTKVDATLVHDLKERAQEAGVSLSDLITTAMDQVVSADVTVEEPDVRKQTTITAFVDPSRVEHVDAIADALGVTRSLVLRSALRKLLGTSPATALPSAQEALIAS